MSGRVFTRVVRELRSQEEVINILKSYHRDQFLVLERSIDPVSYQPVLVFMVVKETGLNEFYSVALEFCPPGTTPNGFFKKKTFLEKVKDVFK